MKINTTRRFKFNSAQSVSLAVLFFIAGFMPAARAASPAELLEKGIYTEETKGELEAANQIYAQIVADQSADRSLVAQAQLRMGLCELKLGHNPKVTTIFEQVSRDFPDKAKLLDLVEKNMPQLLEEIVRQIEQSYFKEVDRGELMETAIRAIVGKLDTSATYLGTNDLAEMNISIQQRIGGIGAVLKADDETHEILVQSTLPGSPASKGGMKGGDRILVINGTTLPAVPELAAVVKMLRGPAGESVDVSVKRQGSDALIPLTLVRDIVRLPNVLGDAYKSDRTWEFMLDDQKKIGYLRLSYLGQQTARETRDALDYLVAHGMKGLILDLRNNPGGLLDGAVAVANLFVKQGLILTVKGRSGDHTYEAKSDDTSSNYAIALLVNRNTASAAEIIAGCLQDHHRAVVIGERTFGQGIVKSIFPLQGGLGALRLPVAAYYRPNGKNVHRYPDSKDSDDWGIQPDQGFEIPMTESELKQYAQYRSQRDNANPPSSADSEFVDRVLQRAVQYLSDNPK